MFTNRASAREVSAQMPKFSEQLHAIADPKQLLEQFRAARVVRAMEAAQLMLGEYKMASEQFSRSPADHAASLSGSFSRFFNSLRDASAALSGASLVPAEHANLVARLHAHVLDAQRSTESLAEQFEGATVTHGGVTYPNVLARALETLANVLEDSSREESPNFGAAAGKPAPHLPLAR